MKPCRNGALYGMFFFLAALLMWGGIFAAACFYFPQIRSGLGGWITSVFPESVLLGVGVGWLDYGSPGGFVGITAMAANTIAALLASVWGAFLFPENMEKKRLYSRSLWSFSYLALFFLLSFLFLNFVAAPYLGLTGAQGRRAVSSVWGILCIHTGLAMSLGLLFSSLIKKCLLRIVLLAFFWSFGFVAGILGEKFAQAAFLKNFSPFRQWSYTAAVSQGLSSFQIALFAAVLFCFLYAAYLLQWEKCRRYETIRE